MATEIQEQIFKATDNAVEAYMKKHGVNHTVNGRIIESLGENKYKVSINGKDYTVRSHWTHAVNDIVAVIVCNGDWGRLYVLY